MSGEETDEQARALRMAGRALARAGLVHAYGHCSLRLDEEHFLVSPSKPLGLVGAGEECHVLAIAEPIPDHVLGEVRIHREIYRRRPDIGGIARTMPRNVMTLAAHGVVPVPRHGFGSYFSPAPALWDDPQLLRSDEMAGKLADEMATRAAILMRGNGAVVAARSIEEAVVLTWYLEDMARIDLAGRAAGLDGADPMTEEQCGRRAVWSGAILERMWDYLTQADPEG